MALLAAALTVGTLLSNCRGSSDLEMVACAYYIIGVHEAHGADWMLLNQPMMYCLPADLPQQGLVDAFLLFASKQGTPSEDNAAGTIYAALLEAFPCPSSPEGQSEP